MRGGKECRLPKLSFDLLVALVEAAPEPVTVDSLMSRVWSGLVVTPETVVQRVKLLRAALGDDTKRPRYIEGLRGRGYRLVAPVATVPCGEAPAGETAASAAGSRSVASRGRRLALAPAQVLAIVAAVVALAAGGFALSRLVSGVPSTATRVAVLPFESLSADAGDALLADGMQDELINALAERTPSLGVIARTTMMTYRGHPQVTASTVGRDLGVAYVVAATLRRDADGIRMTLQLVDAKTDAVLWSHAYDRDPSAIASLRSVAAADLAMHLPAARVSASPAPAAATRSPEAYDRYLRALAALEPVSGIYAACCGTPSLEDLRNVEQLLTQAIALDRDFADAYAVRAGSVARSTAGTSTRAKRSSVAVATI